MRGEIIGVWSHSWAEVWAKLADYKDAPNDLFNELYRSLDGVRDHSVGSERLGEITSDRTGVKSRAAFRDEFRGVLTTEAQAVRFLEDAHRIINEFDKPALTTRFFALVSEFLETYSLRYDLRQPFLLCPTLPGLFATMVRDLRRRVQADAHLAALMRDFEDSLRDLRQDRTEAKLKTCIAKQVNLLEGLGMQIPGVTSNTLGQICNQAATWPHDGLKDSVKAMYRFASDYPGIRHAGTPANAIRAVELRDLAAVAILMAGAAPYLTHGFDAELIYGGLP